MEKMKKMFCVLICILAAGFTAGHVLPVFAGGSYTGHYMYADKKMYSVRQGKRTLKTGTLKAGTAYHDSRTGKERELPRESVYVKGKRYTGYYLSAGNKMYRVRKGTRTLKNGMLRAGTLYYSHHAEKERKLTRQMIYVRGSVYTGLYLGRTKKMYSVKSGTHTLKSGMLKAGASYYSHRAKKRLELSAQAFYINGKPVKGMSTGSLETLQRAHALVTRITNGGMTEKEKLKVCFDYVKTYPECSLRAHYLGMDWPVIYANDIFVTKTGNCCSYAAAFAYMARAVGYEEVYCCNSGGHGWAEIDGLVYDPEWSKHNHVYSYYALSYDSRTDQDYKGAIAAGRPWMHIKI